MGSEASATPAPRKGVIAAVPNAISLARIFATPVLAWAVATGRAGLFSWLLLACLISDIVDGVIARVFGVSSKLGATLDSLADLLVTLVALAGVWTFQRPFVQEHYAPLALLAALYVGENLAALWRYGRLSSFHTILCRLAAYAQGIFLMGLIFFGYGAWLFYAMVAISLAAFLEEFVLIGLVREWRPDIPGLYAILPARDGTR